MARCLLAQMKLSEARSEIVRARKLVAKSKDRDAEISLSIAEARISAASGNVAGAKRLLRNSLLAAQKAGFVGRQFDTRLALAEVEIKAADLVSGRVHLQGLERDATAKGFALVARQAAAALSRI